MILTTPATVSCCIVLCDHCLFIYTYTLYTVLDYFNSHCTSIFLFSTMYFALYCAIKRNKPKIYPRLILPAIASGMTWGVAMRE